ncbi:unnamed protein product, partial [Arctia plantaginis]
MPQMGRRTKRRVSALRSHGEVPRGRDRWRRARCWAGRGAGAGGSGGRQGGSAPRSPPRPPALHTSAMSALRPRARRAPLLLALVVALLPHADRVAGGGGGGSMFGDVNISSILDSFSISYDKRVRPNYGGPPVEVGVT